MVTVQTDSGDAETHCRCAHSLNNNPTARNLKIYLSDEKMYVHEVTHCGDYSQVRNTGTIQAS